MVEATRTVVTERSQLDDLVPKCSKSDAVAFDVETTDTDPMRAELVGIALATSPARSYYIPVRHAGHDGQI